MTRRGEATGFSLPVELKRKLHSLSYLAAAAAVAAIGYVGWPTPDASTPMRPLVPQSTSRAHLEQTVAEGRARLALDAADTGAAVGLADALLRKARVDGDAQHAVEAERVLVSALRKAPADYDAARLLGAVYLSQHRFRDALAAASRARDLRPNDAYNYGTIGDAHLELGEYEEAFDAFDTMVRIRPSASAYARVAYARELQGDFRRAVENLSLAADATGPHDPESQAWHYAQLGNLFLQIGDGDAAAREFARAAHAFPNHPYARVGQARVAAARGNHREALELYQAILDEQPSPETAAAVGDLLMLTGGESAARRQYARAESLEREGWASEEPQPGALARMLAERGLKVEEAVRLAEEAAASRSDIFTLDALSWAWFRAGRIDEARRAAAGARRTGTADRRILYHGAAIEHAAGNDQQARLLLARALDGHSTFDLVAAPAAMALKSKLESRRAMPDTEVEPFAP